MPMVPAAFATEMVGSLASEGFVGVNLSAFCNAIGTGMITGTIGATFSTSDTGTTPGTGAGTGVGLTTDASVILTAMQAEALSKGFVPTPEQEAVFQAAANAYVTQLGLATLTSTHTPVVIGSGTVVTGSIPVTKAGVSSLALAAGLSAGLLGDNWPNVCDIIGAGVVAGLAIATGTVVISGPPPPTPSPGSGVGTGTIT